MVTQPRRIPTEQPIKWTSVNVQEVIDSDFRLKAGVYGIEARQIRKDLERSKWDIVHLGERFIEDSFYWVDLKEPILQKSWYMKIHSPLTDNGNISKSPKPFIASKTNIDIESTRVEKGQVLLTRSGTIGVVSYVSKTLRNQSYRMMR